MFNGKKIETPFSSLTLKDKELDQLNSKCLNYFFVLLKMEDYMYVSTYKNGKKNLGEIAPYI